MKLDYKNRKDLQNEKINFFGYLDENIIILMSVFFVNKSNTEILFINAFDEFYGQLCERITELSGIKAITDFRYQKESESCARIVIPKETLEESEIDITIEEEVPEVEKGQKIHFVKTTKEDRKLLLDPISEAIIGKI